MLKPTHQELNETPVYSTTDHGTAGVLKSLRQKPTRLLGLRRRNAKQWEFCFSSVPKDFTSLLAAGLLDVNARDLLENLRQLKSLIRLAEQAGIYHSNIVTMEELSNGSSRTEVS